MNFSFFKKSKIILDTHERPWGGVYARRMWRWMLGLALLALIFSATVQYHLYLEYTRPIVVSTSSLTSQIVKLDEAGLAKAVTEVKEKEARFNQYLTEKIDITDPAE